MDELLSLAMTMDASRGAYALLLGSGVSRAASIPTGWDVVIDLVRKIARLRGEDAGDDPAAWYATAYGREPEYGSVLGQVAKTPTERHALLRGYFEPTDEDRQANRKVPTRAHRAIASLVRSGHIRLILTTNFDRLMEQSIEAEGVTPTVISTPSAVDGAVPLIHSRCTVVKLHGDYLDTRIKNTATELEKYDRRVTRFLARALDEFGLVVCGWSAEWDIALRRAIEECKTRRFTTYWAARGSLTPAAERVVALRSAQVISVADADSFFTEVAEKVTSLASISQSHPMAAPVAVATLKRYLADPQRRIDLHDMMQRESEQAVIRTSDDAMPVSGTVQLVASTALERIKQYESITSVLAHLMAVGCHWGTDQQSLLMRDCLARFTDRPATGGVTGWIHLRQYPALILLYAGGIASVLRGAYGTLRLLQAVPVQTLYGERMALEALDPDLVLEPPLANMAFGHKQQRVTPVSDRLAAVLREPLREFLPNDKRYDGAFDRFEFLSSCCLFDRGQASWIRGRFIWRDGNFRRENPSVGTALLDEAKTAGDAWPPLRAGLFAGSLSVRTARPPFSTAAAS